MSEITRGAISMPFEMAMGSELSRRQFHSIAQDLLSDNEAMARRLLIVDIVHGPKAEFQWASLIEQNDRLKAENEALKRDKSEPCDGCFMAEAEALRKDAERYRWLRDNPYYAHVQVMQKDGSQPYVYAEELDRSVDFAIVATSKEA